MKKIFFIVLFIAASAAGYSQTVITSLEAKDHIGETVTVKGLVAFVFTTNKGKTLINFDEKYPNQSFTVVVSEESKIDIWRNITAIPNFPECFLDSSRIFWKLLASLFMAS